VTAATHQEVFWPYYWVSKEQKEIGMHDISKQLAHLLAVVKTVKVNLRTCWEQLIVPATVYFSREVYFCLFFHARFACKPISGPLNSFKGTIISKKNILYLLEFKDTVSRTRSRVWNINVQSIPLHLPDISILELLFGLLLVTCDSYLPWQITLRMLPAISQFLCHFCYLCQKFFTSAIEYIHEKYSTKF